MGHGTLTTPPDAVLVDESGPFDGVKTVEIADPGEYFLDVETIGNWSVIIEQLWPTIAKIMPEKSMNRRRRQISEIFLPKQRSSLYYKIKNVDAELQKPASNGFGIA